MKHSSEETVGPAAYPDSNGTEEGVSDSKIDLQASPGTYRATGMAFKLMSLLVLAASIAAIYATMPDNGAQPIQSPRQSASVAPVLMSKGPPVNPVSH